jgi:hypothetical protein
LVATVAVHACGGNFPQRSHFLCSAESIGLDALQDAAAVIMHFA